LAYSLAGKVSADSELSDVFDTRSRIAIAVYKGEVVASMRLIFNEMSDPMEHDQYLRLPSNIPRKDQICEITRVCTHPSYRGSDLLINLFRFVGLAVVQSGRQFILGCATKDLLPLYTKLGFKSTNLVFKHEQLNNIEHTIFIGDVIEGITGKGVNPLIWNLVWEPLATELLSKKMISDDSSIRFRIGVLRLFKPLAMILHYASKTPKRRARGKFANN
jgi:hypothetical protein